MVKKKDNGFGGIDDPDDDSWYHDFTADYVDDMVKRKEEQDKQDKMNKENEKYNEEEEEEELRKYAKNQKEKDRANYKFKNPISYDVDIDKKESIFDKIKSKMPKYEGFMRPGEKENIKNSFSNFSKKRKEKKEFYKKYKKEDNFFDGVENLHDEGEKIWEEKKKSHAYGSAKTRTDTINHPVLGRMGYYVLKGEEVLATNPMTKSVQKILNNSNNKKLVNDGANPAKVLKLRELEQRYDHAKYTNDEGLKRDLEFEIIQKKHDINVDILTEKKITNKEKRDIIREQLQLQKLANEARMDKNEKKVSQKMTKEEKQFDYRHQGRKAYGIPYLPRKDSVSFENSAGFSRPNVSIPSFAGYGNMKFDNRANMEAFARQRIIDRRQVALNEQAMRRDEAIRKDQELNNAFTGKDRFRSMITGDGVPHSDFSNITSKPQLKKTGSVLKFKGVDLAPIKGGLVLAMPRIGFNNVNRRAPVSNNNKGGMIVSRKSKQVNSANKIASGIENMVSPHRAMAQAHKNKMYHSPECAIANICGNVKSAGKAHTAHVKGFDIKSGIKMPKVNVNTGILQAITARKKKRAKK